MSFLTALLDAAGGYGAGRQQRTQQQQEQQRLNQEQAYRQSEEARQNAQLTLDQQRAALEKQRSDREQDAYTANSGIDPATGKPFLMPLPVSRVPANATPQQLIQHYDTVARWASQTHQTDLYNWAKTQQAETLRQLDAAQTQAGEDRRTQQHIDEEAQIHGAPTYADLHPKPLTPSEQMDADQEAWNKAHGKPPGYRPSNADPGAQQARVATRLKGDFDEFWANATAVPTQTNAAGMKVPLLDPKTKKPIQPGIPPEAQPALRDEFTKMDESPNPKAYADGVIKQIQKKAPPAVIEALRRRAAWRQAELDAEGGATGGSNAGGDPTSPWH